MQGTCILHRFQRIEPMFVRRQAELAEWFARAFSAGENELRYAQIKNEIDYFGCNEAAIARRGFECADIMTENCEQMLLYQFEDGGSGAPWSRRSSFYRARTEHALRRFYPDPQAIPPSDIIHVTCTGYRSPSAPQYLVDLNGWHEKTAVLHAYHMGCYAALPGVRMAKNILAERVLSAENDLHRDSAEHTCVDIVHTELCGIHFHAQRRTPDQLVSYSLFADGLIKYSAVTPESFNRLESDLRGLEVLRIGEQIIPGTGDAMTWEIGDECLEMTLSKNVPDLIAAQIGPFIERLAYRSGVTVEQLRDSAIFAIHPGGPRILDAVEHLLKVPRQSLRYSRDILLEHGNMSSATLPHIWMRILNDRQVPSETMVVSVAFGPGLTCIGGVMRVVNYGRNSST